MNWYKIAQKQYCYELSCVDLNEGMPIQEMINQSIDISWEEFNEHVSTEQVNMLFGNIYDYDDINNGAGLKIQDDYTVSFHKSYYEGTPCYYLDHSAIEYIFLPCGGLYD